MHICHLMVPFNLVDCVPGQWTNWTECNADCGPQTVQKSRISEVTRQGEGAICSLIEKRDCPVKKECAGKTML